jgi:hypothetical protein
LWRNGGNGAGGQLYVHVQYNLPAVGGGDPTPDGKLLAGMNVVSIESAHASDPSKLATVTEETDVSLAFTVGKQAASLAFMPLGDNYPVRFWQIQIRWDIWLQHGDPPLTVAAGYY